MCVGCVTIHNLSTLKIIQPTVYKEAERELSKAKQSTVPGIIMWEVGGMAYATSIQAQFMKIKTHDIIQYFKKHTEDSNCLFVLWTSLKSTTKPQRKSAIIACEAIITVLKLLKLHVCTSSTNQPNLHSTAERKVSQLNKTRKGRHYKG